MQLRICWLHDSDILRGLEHVFGLRWSVNIAAVNLSLDKGFATDRASCDANNSDYKDIIDNLRSFHIAPWWRPATAPPTALGCSGRGLLARVHFERNQRRLQRTGHRGFHRT